MLQCTSIAVLPPVQTLTVLAMCDSAPDGSLAEISPDALCELGENHADHHASYLWDDGEITVWFLWGDDGYQKFIVVPWCGVPDHADEEVCTLYRDHPSDHSWAVTDPLREAEREEMERLVRGWIRRADPE
ncbi:hypothetical protein [Streptomyces asiaticus]